MKKLLLFVAAMFTAVTMSAAVAEMTYTGETTVNMAEGNNAALVNLDASLFTVTASKGSATNMPGLNKNDKDIRLYSDKENGDGTEITIAINGGTINSIAIEFTEGYSDYLQVKVGDNAVTEADGAFAVNAAAVTLKNIFQGDKAAQVRIKKVTITYTGGVEKEKYAVTVAPATNGTLVADVTTAAEGEIVTLTVTPNDGYLFDKLTATVGEEVTDISSSVKDGVATYSMPGAAVTFAATFKQKVAVSFVKKDIAQIAATDQVLITMTNADGTYAMSYTKLNAKNAPLAVSVTVSAGKITVDDTEGLLWNVAASSGVYTFYTDCQTVNALYAISDNNGLRIGSDENNTFSISEEGYLFNEAQSRYVGIYNSTDFRCYTSINNNIKEQTLEFYVKEAGAPTAIEDAQVRDLDINAPMYNVMGQQVTAEYKGVVIQNGQKFLLR